MMTANGTQMIQIQIHGRAAMVKPEHAPVILRKNKLVSRMIELIKMNQTPVVLAERIDTNRKILAVNRKIQREGICVHFQ